MELVPRLDAYKLLSCCRSRDGSSLQRSRSERVLPLFLEARSLKRRVVELVLCSPERGPVSHCGDRSFFLEILVLLSSGIDSDIASDLRGLVM